MYFHGDGSVVKHHTMLDAIATVDTQEREIDRVHASTP